jgi:hypothetical protein
VLVGGGWHGSVSSALGSSKAANVACQTVFDAGMVHEFSGHYLGTGRAA